MRKLVLDSSVIVKWLNEKDEEHISQANKILKEVEQGFTELLAPELVKYEVGNVLHKGKLLSFSQAQSPHSLLSVLPITFIVESKMLAIETYRIATSFGFTYYDAPFLAIAARY